MRVAPETACRPRRPHRGPPAAGGRRAAESPTPPAVPERLRDVVLAIVRDRPLAPVARISTSRTVEMLYGPDGSAVAEFCDDQVTASAEGGDEQQWREWELELAEGGDLGLLDRLSNRLLDAGALPAGHGSKLARVLESTAAAEGAEPSDDPVHRAVATHVDELLVWDRAVRADIYDSVHQMRVTTRKIRSLLRPPRSRSVSPTTSGSSTSCGCWPGAGGSARCRGARRTLRARAGRAARRTCGAPCASVSSRAPEALPQRLEAVVDGDALASATSGCSTRSRRC